jgi:hypothetical protein
MTDKIKPMWMIPNEEGKKIHVLVRDLWYFAKVAKDGDECYYLENYEGEPLKEYLHCRWIDFEGWREIV